MDAMGGVDDHSKQQSPIQSSEEDNNMDLRRGPWTVEEDLTLINYIALHGEGRWNSLARNAGLKRTGKSCRLRWLNYLRPDVRRGNITLEEQLLILELHSRWGNRWSKIAQHLPGRTDNEIKNYWRTRVQKHAKQLKCDVNSKQFKDAMRYLWMPRLIERIQASAGGTTNASPSTAVASPGGSTITTTSSTNHHHRHHHFENHFEVATGHMALPTSMADVITPNYNQDPAENSSVTVSSEHFTAEFSPPMSDLTDNSYGIPMSQNPNPDCFPASHGGYQEILTSPSCGYFNYGLDFQAMDQWLNNGELSDNLWNVEDVWFTQPQSLHNNF